MSISAHERSLTPRDTGTDFNNTCQDEYFLHTGLFKPTKKYQFLGGVNDLKEPTYYKAAPDRVKSSKMYWFGFKNERVNNSPYVVVRDKDS